jgi:hypothetical protein
VSGDVSLVLVLRSRSPSVWGRDVCPVCLVPLSYLHSGALTPLKWSFPNLGFVFRGLFQAVALPYFVLVGVRDADHETSRWLNGAVVEQSLLLGE